MSEQDDYASEVHHKAWDIRTNTYGKPGHEQLAANLENAAKRQAAGQHLLNLVYRDSKPGEDTHKSEELNVASHGVFAANEAHEQAEAAYKANLWDAEQHYKTNAAQYQEQAAEHARADGVDLNFEMSHRDQANFVADHAEADEAAHAAAKQHPAA